jgi:hypothetical protein
MERNQKDRGNKQKETKRSDVRHVLKDHAQFGKKFRPPLLDHQFKAGHGPLRLEVVAAVLDLYAESYSVVSRLAGAESCNSAAVETWYKEANEARGWGMYTPSEENDTEPSDEEEADQQTQQSIPSSKAEDDPAK